MDLSVEDDAKPSPRQLPSDLPRSLDDRRSTPVFGTETEMYDAWQGQSILTTPVIAQPLQFNLSLESSTVGDDPAYGSSDDGSNRLVKMLASQARLRGGSSDTGEDAILNSDTLTDVEKRKTLQDLLAMAASNGEMDRVLRLLTGPGKDLVDVNAPDAEGNVPIIYASCFGHTEVVKLLVEHKADIDKRDYASWSSLMWAITNGHKEIVKYLLDHGASPDVKTTSGRTAFDFVAPDSDMSEYLHGSGYKIGNVGVTDDFYDSGFSQDKFEEEMAESELRRRMMMESSINLEVDLGNLALDEQTESPTDDFDDGQEFQWDRCLNDQMFVFQESDLDRILDVVITKMAPSRSPSQKPVPANLLFLAARYAYYHARPELLEVLLSKAFAKINQAVEVNQLDMTMLAFWLSNTTLLLHYLRKDAGLVDATPKYQLALSEVIQEIFILITRDAERRMDKILDRAMLEYESIPGFEDVTFKNEWKIFKSRPKAKAPEPLEKRLRPPSPKRKAQTAPRNVTSLLSSTLFVLELYDIHSVIIVQVLAQLLYWLGARIFNRILQNKKYLARTKAMQIRMNISTLEDWALSNNRQAEHYENGSMVSTGETTGDAARKFLEPAHQLLQWLQVSSSIGEDFESLISTRQQLPRLNPQQLIYAAKNYRAEVEEASLPKSAIKYLETLHEELAERKAKELAANRASRASTTTQDGHPLPPSTPTRPDSEMAAAASPAFSTPTRDGSQADDLEAPYDLMLDEGRSLPFSLPTSTDMLVSYGAGFGGKNRERERRYIPTVPPEFLTKLDFSSSGSRKSSIYEGKQWDTSD